MAVDAGAVAGVGCGAAGACAGATVGRGVGADEEEGSDVSPQAAATAAIINKSPPIQSFGLVVI
ncbi:MAG: hypothetical protein IIB17_11030 [Chloroflexi bacterium]|nr:hypothetical protein [Chloroflexota bacterium]